MIMIVEDDDHKLSQIIEILDRLCIDEHQRVCFDNVKDAVRYLVNVHPRKILLDMSLPSHKALPGQGTPLPMPTGGIEILFELKRKRLLDTQVLILTQFPEIDIEDEPYPTNESAPVFKEEYGFSRLEACHYEHLDGAKWIKITEEFLRK
ncbi:hypothetical protein [Pantoea sp. SS70]|uniref:hypothetical protein n=1 Tax=Pantoea sp. SS70 TaxID=3024247 RepID=UPI00245309C3|nr:hypothetical protein [Pantoea sp. SS70]WGK60046.1 hypothetical protein PO881_23150 [Pantoea sp. SS70]